SDADAAPPGASLAAASASAADHAEVVEARAPVFVPKVEEITGDGVLRPALVIGLGHGGQTVLQRLLQCGDERIGALSKLPDLRMVYLDTDPEAQRAVQGTRPGKSLAHDQVLVARLNRPSHY